MVTERFTVVALPHSRAAGADFHVSLFISPDLTPDGSVGTLSDFKHFLHWAAVVLDDATFELRDQQGAIAAKPLLGPVSPDVWDAVFPSDTPVAARTPIDWSGRRWRTFRAAELHDAGKLLHLAAMFSDPTSPPAPLAHPVGRLLGRLGAVSDGRRAYDESRFTAMLDDQIGETAGPTALGKNLAKLEQAIDEAEPFRRFILQLHRARRFYERPEAAELYLEHPEDGETRPRPPRHAPDFHERCTLVGDHPSLQRRLGLVIDIAVDDPSRLSTSQWLRGRIVPQSDQAACRSTRTRCETAGDDLVVAAATDDWAEGRLRLGDSDRFAVLDIDPDGTALKLDRFVWSLPRLVASQRNGDPVHAAPTALRSIGFTVVRHKKAVQTQERLAKQHELMTAIDHGEPPLLDAEDVTQGLRVEVWDSTSKAWFSLHQRRIDAEAAGHGAFMTDSLEEGFIEGTTATETPDVADSPIHVHESVFGWEGWSLSASRPGKRVRHENGQEIVEEPTAHPDPLTPLVVTSHVEPGTLPRLRYGRSYAFRAWAVDLAGNSRVHSLGPAPPAPAPAVSAVSTLRAAMASPAKPAAYLEGTLRAEATAGIMERRAVLAQPPVAELAPDDLTAASEPEIERGVLHRLRVRRSESRAPSEPRSNVTADRATVVGRAFAEAVADDSQPLITETAAIDPGELARLALVSEGTGALRLPKLIDTVSPRRPFLRWDPVQPPAVVSRHRYSAGESLRQLVIRSGVTQDLETLEITVTPPEQYSGDHVELGYRASSERHLAPPKTSQSESELHGAFDEAIGSTDAADHTKLLAVALREAGTLFDVDVPRLNDPSLRDPQPGIDLAHDPGVPASTLKSLPLASGEMPASGQYIIHDTDQLALPYLPDVPGRGISLVFQEAGRDRQIAFPFGTEGFTARYEGVWPELQPFRLMLEGGEQLEGSVEGSLLCLELPPGDIQRFRLASCLDRSDLDLFGLWRVLPPAIRGNRDVQEAAADGWLWAFTPYDEITLVHAVPRPLEAPRPTKLVAIRPGMGATDAVIFGAVDVHGPSTESITAEASWVDPVDDLSLPAPENRPQRGIGFTTSIREKEDLAVLAKLPNQTEDLRAVVPGAGPVWIHLPIHRLEDTKHRTIQYRFRATTRFREYFDTSALTPVEGGNGDGPADDGLSVVGPKVEVSVPSSARPAAPLVHSILPLFRWDQSTEPEQPLAVRRRRRAGVRIYLERPWFSSGEDELLGILLAPLGNDAGLDKLASQWGVDPVWLSAPVDRRAMLLELDNLLRAVGLEDRPGDALPVVPPATLPLAAKPDRPMVTVLGYRPQYSVDRQMWYVDVAVDPGSTLWPFVRLGVARYQPDSINDCHLSAPVLCDYVQLTPERTTSVSRTDVRHIRVVVSGPVGVRNPPRPPQAKLLKFPTSVADLAEWVNMNRTVVARLQRRDSNVPTDLGWQTVNVVELSVRGHGRTSYEAAWVGELESAEDLPLRRPGENPDWRVTVEEWERLPGDPADLGAVGLAPPPPIWERRLIYAEEVAL